MPKPQTNNARTTDDEVYTLVPIIPVDFQFHTDEHPECFDPECNCKQQKIADLSQAVIDGLATPDDATRVMQGKTV